MVLICYLILAALHRRWTRYGVDHKPRLPRYGTACSERRLTYRIVCSTVTLGTIPGLAGTSIVGSENAVEPFGPVLTGSRSIGGAVLSLDILHPLCRVLPIVMQVDIIQNAKGDVGF